MNSCLESLMIRALHKLPAENAHRLSLRLLAVADKLGIISANNRAKKLYSYGGLEFTNLVGLAAGFDKNGDAIDALAACGFGFIELGTVTPKAQQGNQKPRLFRLSEQQSIINRMGFNNKGVDYLVDRLKASKSTIIKGVNIGKNKDTLFSQAADDYVLCMEKVYPYANYIVINVSSPNTPELRRLQIGQALRDLLTRVARCRDDLNTAHNNRLPVLVKIAPDMSYDELAFLVDIIVKTGLDGIVATNTTTDRPESIAQLPVAQEQGGLSGVLLANKSTRVLQQLSNLLPKSKLLVSVGGISSADIALERLQMGANLVQLYTSFVYKGTGLVQDTARRCSLP